MMQFSEFLADAGAYAISFNSNKRKLKIVALSFIVPLQKIIVFGVSTDFSFITLTSYNKCENIWSFLLLTTVILRFLRFGLMNNRVGLFMASCDMMTS